MGHHVRVGTVHHNGDVRPRILVPLKLVREDKISAEDVMTGFWACLIATSNVQMCIPQFIILAKGKFSMVSLISLATSPPQSWKLRVLKKIMPVRCSDKLALHNVPFAYLSRLTILVFSNVSTFLSANQITFIVGPVNPPSFSFF